VGVHRLKDERYDHTRYMVELAAPGTVDTAPEKTIEAVADHGVISGNTIAGPYLEARTVFGRFGRARCSWPGAGAAGPDPVGDLHEDGWSADGAQGNLPVVAPEIGAQVDGARSGR
jgi:hypothetical protein